MDSRELLEIYKARAEYYPPMLDLIQIEGLIGLVEKFREPAHGNWLGDQLLEEFIMMGGCIQVDGNNLERVANAVSRLRRKLTDEGWEIKVNRGSRYTLEPTTYILVKK